MMRGNGGIGRGDFRLWITMAASLTFILGMVWESAVQFFWSPEQQFEYYLAVGWGLLVTMVLVVSVISLVGPGKRQKPDDASGESKEESDSSDSLEDPPNF